MTETAQQKFVDHPAPSTGLFSIFLFSIAALLASLPLVAADLPPDEIGRNISIGAFATIGISIAILCFYFWPLFTTYYTMDAHGIVVKYGPWIRRFPWDEFTTAYWQKGMFATRIGWPSTTPCVRLSNGVVLKRKKKWGLYLTPNSPEAFLQKLDMLAPELTHEMIKEHCANGG
ncbi:hypothetical protein PDESU_05423 [Pontiella desulfatans]|uniref:Uncharacterized protein n=1 Tax=Pontiella desulfatans TaxID=2750659 RepID=A0A6C2UBL0_PONDE|nr:hypothetical protein [Pontiella desulfatans]VGO16831.1 hypothetical protein PDESU_05423 [Pontiella desulfatans]